MVPNYNNNNNNSINPSKSFSFMDKSEDHPYHIHEASFSLSSRTIIRNTDQDHTPCYYREQLQLQNQVKVGQSAYSSMERATDSARRSSALEKEDRAGNQSEHGSSDKWLSSKMRMMRKMMSSDQLQKTPNKPMQQKFQDHKQLSSSLETDNGSSSSNNSPYSNNNNIIRICSDCNTSKTPLWRSGPKGPKSLCNACGIRQRKARRAMAAAAAEAEANGAVQAAAMKNNKVQHKYKGSSAENFLKPFKKRFKGKTPPPSASEENDKTGLEDLTMSLSKQYSAFQQVFPQDEREGAILLMALSHGLVQG